MALTLENIDSELIKSDDRIKVQVRCHECGEKFMLRGSVKNGEIDTGVKMCICGNVNLQITLAD